MTFYMFFQQLIPFQVIIFYELFSFTISIIIITNTMSKQEQAQVYQMLSVLFLTASKGQQVQQCIKEVITSHPLFCPFSLFRYISKNQSAIRRENLRSFLEENKEIATQQQIKTIIGEGVNRQQWQYSDFLRYIYPFNSAILREISNLHIKRYTKLEKYGVHQAALTGFLMLLIEQIALIRKLQVQKGDSLLKIPKQRLRKVLLSIKKAADRQPSHCQNDNTRITSLELRNFMRAFVSVEDSHFLFLSRRLGMKNGSFPLQMLQKFIKNRKRPKQAQRQRQNYGSENKHKSPIRYDDEDQNIFNEKSYRQQLIDEFTSSIKIKQSPNRKKYPSPYQGLRQIDLNQNNCSQNRQKPEKRYAIEDYYAQQPQDLMTERYQPSEHYFINKQKEETRTTSPKELFVRFIEVFLPAAREVEELKLRISSQQVDYLRLFKQIVRSNRGVADASDFAEFYRSCGGQFQLSPKQFELIIGRYGQSQQSWITFAQFCEMVRAQQKQPANKSMAKFGENTQDLVIKILQTSIKSESTIMKIRRQFKRHESKYLFNLINREHTGFINYQQLKKYLIESGLHLSMHDLMAVLKRLDKSRNGVIVEHEFVSYFQPPQGF